MMRFDVDVDVKETALKHRNLQLPHSRAAPYGPI